MANDNMICGEPTNEVPLLSRDRACDILGRTSSVPSEIQSNITINAHNSKIKGNSIVGGNKIGNQYIYNGDPPLPAAEFLLSEPRRLWGSLKLYNHFGAGFSLLGGIGITSNFFLQYLVSTF